MNRLLTITVVLLGGWWTCGASAAGQLLPVPDRPTLQDAQWPMEQVELLDGRRYDGYVESEDEIWVHLIQIRRRKGKPMHLVIRPIERKLIAAVSRLDEPQRAKLQQRIELFRNRSRIEKGRADAIRLGLITKEGNHYYHYRGKWFTFDSNAEEALTRRMIVRVEQMFTAYRQILAPRTEPQRPLRVVVLRSMHQYHAFLARHGIRIKSPACFIEDDNLVVAGSELARFAAQMAEVKAHHDKLRSELKQLEKRMPEKLAELGRRLREAGHPSRQIRISLNIEKAKLQKEIDGKRTEIKRCERRNARVFDELTRRMFARLYHEAFHAYLENYVYPHENHHVPRWLNEGLAVMFEEGLLESDTLRVDAPNPAALERLKADLNGEQPLPLEKLLAADQQAFVQAHGADRYYVYSWGLVYYLAFEKRLLGSAPLQQYVQPSANATSPVQRFEKLIGVPLSKFEQDWREYVFKLR